MEQTLRVFIAVVVFTAIFALSNCTHSNPGFMRVGDTDYPPKPGDFQIAVFEHGEIPERDYQVIGLVYTPSESAWFDADPDEIIAVLKKEARKHGADAIMDIRIMNAAAHDTQTHAITDQEYRSGQATAIVFK